MKLRSNLRSAPSVAEPKSTQGGAATGAGPSGLKKRKRKPTEPTVSPPDVKGKGKGKISRLEAQLRESKAKADAQRQQMAMLIARIDMISIEEALKQIEEQEKLFMK
jgi:hypothetical protein